MAARDGKIGATMGGVSRAVGNDVTDVATLERRREAALKLERRAPAVPFAEVLAAGAKAAAPRPRFGRRQPGDDARPDGGGEQEEGEPQKAAQAPSQKDRVEPAPRPGGFRPRGRAPLVRG